MPKLTSTEATIRDQLALQLETVEPGLELLDKEKFIPNEIGTRGFIDLAKDASGRYVLIEVKRTDAAAREAVHEILKYVEGVKKHFGLREDELKVIIAAVEWKELLVPFSSFVSRTACVVEGFSIAVEDGMVTGVGPVRPLELNFDRLLAPWHEVNHYHDAEGLRKGITDYENACAGIGIETYVLVELDTPDSAPNGLQSTKQIAMKNVIAGLAATMGAATRDVPDEYFKHILYFGMQQLSKDEYQNS